jgi:glycosyltransferase involved in cell wall biosynthesis
MPIVASDLPVHQEICRDAAVYFPFDSPETLAERIYSLVASPGLASQLSARGRERSVDFSWRKHADQILALARELISKDTVTGDNALG